jgi:hypothetical protein
MEWKLVELNGEVTYPLFNGSAASVKDKMYIFGGHAEKNIFLDIFDPGKQELFKISCLVIFLLNANNFPCLSRLETCTIRRAKMDGMNEAPSSLCHVSPSIGNRLYTFSSRNGQACMNDMRFFDIGEHAETRRWFPTSDARSFLMIFDNPLPYGRNALVENTKNRGRPYTINSLRLSLCLGGAAKAVPVVRRSWFRG